MKDEWEIEGEPDPWADLTEEEKGYANTLVLVGYSVEDAGHLIRTKRADDDASSELANIPSGGTGWPIGKGDL